MSDKNLAVLGNNTGTLPGFAKSNAAGAGMDNVSAQDMSTPQIKLIQAMSPELQEMDGLKQGQLFNTVNRVAYDELYVVSLYYKSAATIFHKAQRQFIDNAETVEKAQTIVEGLPGSPTDYDIQETKTHYCVALDTSGKELKVDFPFVMHMKKTQIRISNDWNTEINNRYGDQTARWAGIWKMTSKKRSNDKGTWFIPSIEFAGYVPDEKLFAELGKTYESVSGRKLEAAA